MTYPNSKTLVFVDSAVANYESLISGIHSDAEIIVLDSTQDGIEQITKTLAERSEIASVHIVSHGAAGKLQLGSTQLTEATLSHYAAQLQGWSTALTANADILLYGCDVAAGTEGAAFVRELSTLTGADIAASIDRTGNANLNGDWVLETTTGQIESPLAFHQETLDTYTTVLPILFQESFSGDDVIDPNWIFASKSNHLYLTARDTDAASPGGLPGNPNSADPDGSGALRLTTAGNNQAGFVIYNTPINASQGLSVTFNFAAYGGSGADGTVFFLIDGNANPTDVGGFGGSLGYANNSSEAGLLGGYLGVGVDEFGNFSNPTEGRVGGPGQKADSIAIRGSQATNYKYLAGTNTLPTSIDNNSGGANRSNSQRKILIEITPSGLLSVQVDLNNDGDYTDPGEPAINLADITAVNGALPNTFKFGFASSTGGSHNIHEVRNLEITTYNDPPAVADASVTVSTGTTLNLTGLTATDSNGTVTSFTITSLPDAADGVLYFGDPATGGTLVTAGQVFTPAQIGQIYFQATAGFNGGSFTYTATDDEGKSDPTPATVTLALNGTPTTNVATVTVSASTTVNLTGLSGTDPDGSVTAYTITSLPTPADGTLYLGNPASGGTAVTLGQSIPAASIGNLYFQATAGFNGGSFTYAATDNSGITDPTPATVSLNIPPVAANAAVNITANATVKLSGLSATDLDNRVQTYTLSTLPIAAQGTLYLGNPASGGTPVTAGQILTTDQIVQLYFQAEAGFSGATFTYTATDEAGGTDPTPATVTLTKITNAPPTANNIAATVKPGNTLNLPALSASDSDGNSSVIYYTIASLPDPADGVLYLNDPASGGTPVVAGQTFEASQINKLFFQATAGFDGGSFTYTVADTKGAADSTPATVTLNVPGVMITPTGGSTEVAEGGATDTYSVVLASAPTADVTITLATDGQTSTNAPTLTFTSANWNVPQTVTVTAVDDAVVEGTHPATITHTATSTDPNYNGIAIAPVPITITDNDIAGVNLSTPNLTTGENGTTATFDVVLNSQPTADVTITLVNGDPTEGTLSTTMLTFTAANWNQPQVVTVTGVDDLTVDGNIVYTIGTTATSSDPNYNDIAVPDVTVTNADNDIAGVIITPSGGGTNSAEGGASDTYTVQLASQPTAPVTITINNDGQTGTNVTTLTFDASNWNIPQTVTVSAVDDATAEGTHPGTIAHTASSIDPLYNGIAIAPVPVEITDNDIAGVSLSTTTLTTGENGTTATFDVVLTSQPTDPVTITLTNGDATEGSLSTTTLTFDASNWNQPQTITVIGIDDLIADGNVTYAIATTATSIDPNYNSINVPDINVTNTDNDIAGVSLSTTTLTTGENGTTATFNVVLTSQPTDPVTITLTNGDATEGSLSTTTLTFDASNWNQPQTITVTGVNDDLVDGNIPYTIATTASSADPNYNSINVPDVTVTNTDNDTAGVVITPSDGTTNVTEGGTSDTYTIVMTSQPTAPVMITINNDGQTGTNVTTLTFDASNWNIPQTVTVSAVDDATAEGTHPGTITHTATSTDPNYNGSAIAPVPVTLTDNDSAGVSLSNTTLTTSEDGTNASFQVALTSQPTDPVTITLTNGDPTEGSLSTTTLTFTSANWNQPQTVTVTGIDDPTVDGDVPYTIDVSASSTDTRYDTLEPLSIAVTNTDNDTAGVTISNTTLITSENGSTASFEVVLTSAPTAEVTITLGNGDPSEGTLSTTTLTFTAANWNQPQTVSVTGVDDPIVDGDVLYTIDTTATSTDPNYNTITVPDITITNTDNDIAGIVITSSGGSTDLTEGGASDTYTVVLTSQPIAPVTITINNGGQTSTGVTTLTFDATNWNQPQTVTVTAVDDPVVEGLHTDTITHTVTSTDPNYNGISVAPVTATITDNDIPSISITPANLFTTEAGGTATFDVTLTSQPASDVTITLVNSDPTEGTLSTTTIVFTPANWNQPQTVTVTGVDDVVDDGDISYTIGGTATSTDPNYDNITAPDVTITNIDNDGVGVTITPNNLTTGENGTIAGFSLVLDSAPSADVTVTLTNGDPTEGTLSTTTIVFTPANWNQPQTVTVTGVDDPTIDGNISYTIATAITSPDPSYDNIAVADLIITNTDNDIAGISITSTNLTTSENGTTASFAVVLNTAPTADVTLTLTNGDPTEGTLNTTMLTFTTANWNQPQTVTVSGLDDAIVDGNIPYTITTSVSSNDPNYNTIAVPAITVTNTDNDIPATNNPPATTDGAISVNPNAITQLIGLGATDPDGDPIQSYTLSSLPPADQGTLYLGDPTKGGIPITNGQILSPADINNLFFKTTPGFNGGISFQYTATDSKDVTDPTPAIVSLNLATSPSIPTNTSPTTLDVTNSTLIHPDTAVPISGLNAVDPDGSIAYFTITSLPPADHGVLYLGDPMNGGIAIAAGQTLTPDQLSQLFFRASNTFVGDTRFTYTATDNLGATDLSAATIVLASANRGDGCYEKPYQHQVGVFRKGRNRKEKLQGTNGSDRIFGRNGNDVLRGEGDDDRLSGGLGNDRLNGQTGRDSLTGGMGNDRIRGGSSPDILRGGRGKDRLWGGTSADRLFGDRENDQLFGQECHDTLRGGIGNDKLNGGTGNDRLSGNQGKDRLWGGNGNDTLGGGLQNDQLGGARGNDRLNGGKGRDRLWGGADHDILNGGMGNDTLKGGNGNDRVNGNQGKDRLWGGNGNDVLGGGLQNDRLGGGRGNDRLSGGKGRDRLWGGADYDTLNGGLNRDTLKGGGGSDTLRGGLDRDTLQGGGGNDRAFGGRGNDFLGGGEGTDTLNGGLNHDRLVGWAGQDFLRGGAGNDFLDGGGKRDRDADTLLGGLGKDTLVGGFGADVLAGGYGRDRFVYRKAGEGGDVITDFESRDVIDVSRILASRKFAGSKSLRNLKVTQIGSDTLIQIDTNGKVSGGLQPLATLENVAASTLKSTHFIFT